jgi:ABC-2 type transport system permease protein
MWLRVYALILRHLYLYRRSLARVMEVVFWPVMNLLLWGFVTAYLERFVLPATIIFLLGAMILWDVLYRSQQAITLSLTEEFWVKNVLNVFIAPVRIVEMMTAYCAVGILKAAATTVLLGSLAFVLYRFNLLAVGPALVPFLAGLLLFGWAVGMFTMGLVIRYGHAAEALIWGVPFLIQPLSAVFYPVDVLPAGLQSIARLLPSTYVFEGMRIALQDNTVNYPVLLWSYGLNLVYLACGAGFFGWMLKRAREKGYLSRTQME